MKVQPDNIIYKSSIQYNIINNNTMKILNKSMQVYLYNVIQNGLSEKSNTGNDVYFIMIVYISNYIASKILSKK